MLQGVGQSGANPDYVLSTVRHLRQLGIHDPELEALSTRLEHALGTTCPPSESDASVR